jgi:hypothetical protein
MPDEPTERSDSGTPIIRHRPSERGWTPPKSASGNLQAIQEHLAEHIGPVENVFHELISDLVHLDVLMIPPAADRPFNVLVTSGMSDLPMTVPNGMENFRRAEVMIALPSDWPLDYARFDDERVYWPIRWLKMLGRLPHEFNTWLGYGHSVPNGDPPEPIPGTKFTGVMTTFARWLPRDFSRLELGPARWIFFYQMVPLYPEEMDLKLNKGTEALVKRFEERDISFVLDPNRPNVARRKRLFGLF